MFALYRMPLSRCSRSSQGYSLTELAIILAIIGLVSGMTLSVGKVQMDVAELQGTQERLDAVRSALLLFQKKHMRYPCPALPDDTTASATYGVEVAGGCDAACPAGLTCDNSAVIGAIPFRTLKLNEELAYDSWDGKMAYIVDKNHTVNSEYNTGGIPVVDSHGNEITASPMFGDAIFVLVSHGKDGKGAYGKSGAVGATCGTGKDADNCDLDDTFVDDRLTMGDVAANYYDDLILWQTQENVHPAAPPPAAVIDAGDFNACALKADKTVWCWGLNDGGQLGDGTTSDRSSPVQVSGLTNAAQIAANSWHSCAVKTDGTAWCWGRNPDGRLGDGTMTNRSMPVQVAGLTNVSQLDTGDFHSCAVKTDGTAWCWGLNHDMWNNTGGQIGNGTWGDNPLAPTQVVGGLSNVKQVTTGYLHSCALKNDGTAWCWGSNHKPDWGIDTGQLGDGTFIDRYSPVQVSGLTNVSEIRAADFHTCALKTDGTVWCWGRNDMTSMDPGYVGYLGDGTAATRTMPVQVSGLTNVTHIDADDYQSCALKADGTVWCWGANNWGQLGDGTTMSRLTPVQVAGLTDAVSIKVGERHTCAGKNDGTVWCWGLNDKGQLGNGTTAGSLIPVQVLSMP